MTYNLDFFSSKPQTESDWLLQLGEAPDLQDNKHIYEVIKAIDKLSPQSKFCIEAIFYERIPFSKLGERLGVSKPHAWRLANKAMEELKQLLSTNKVLNERYKMFSTWDESVTATINNLDTLSSKRKVEIKELENYMQHFWEFVKDGAYEETIFVDMLEIGVMALEHLKSIGAWNKEETIALLIKKQHDYGHQNILGFGAVGLAVRLSDKIARLISLEKRGTRPHNESIIDTWTDIVGYSAIAQMLENGTFKLELEAF